MRVTVEDKNGSCVVNPEGEVDLSNSRELQAQMRQVMSKRPHRVIVNLDGVPYMDSSGVATLVEAMQMARKQKTDLILCGLQDKVRSIFEIARLDKVFTIVDSVDEGLSV